MTRHTHCPACNALLEGVLIWQTFVDQGKTEDEADDLAAMYGATRTKGRWGLAIGIYCMERDRTVAYRCPKGDHEWSASGPTHAPGLRLKTTAGTGLLCTSLCRRAGKANPRK